ncbi:BTB/POZ domain-containing protein KCTD7-like [Mercenaria mercenaria]|uniref:BTB/POZ domain-containing protein KCTD7-like n=1 Tax=Mercenaria mercenaria TaxID=6596 RepID=UPI00234E932B|nr:BTB/POZ domain-containing protein KCTD7-like [Mercenaria mercenaria]
MEEIDENSKFPPIIELNVGGRFFTTTHLTLTKCPDNMLSAMFSGKYSVIKDKDGRFFIDADGENFIHILNYLRYGDLPPPQIAETVYREAAYFGIHGLVKELEKFPQIMAKIQRNNFRNQFPGYAECLDLIVKAASVETSSQTSEVKVLIYSKQVVPQNENFDMNHKCTCEGMKDTTYTPDAKLGPWKGNSTEKDVLNCLIFDLESQGFTVTSRFHGPCTYVCERICCNRSFYNICFHWWRS